MPTPISVGSTGISDVCSARLQKAVSNTLAYPVLLVIFASLMTSLVQYTTDSGMRLPVTYLLPGINAHKNGHLL